jgi:hypothetical protein
MPEQDTSERLFFPIQVRAVGDAARIATLNDILRRDRVLDTAVLEEHPPYFFRGEISSSRLDGYYTRMLLSSLQNYAREAAAGVGFLPSHDHEHLPIGGSLTGELSEQAGTDNAPANVAYATDLVSIVRADFYTLSRMTIQTVDTDDLINGIRGGLTRYLSIGWYGQRAMICDICGQDYWRGGCRHIAGFTYEEEKDGVIRQLLATVGIDGAHLAEVSGVYKGATPGAMIEKVYELASQGALTIDDVRHAEVVYRLDKATTARMLALPALQKRHAGVDIQSDPAANGAAANQGQQPGKVTRMNEQQFGQLVDTLIRAGVLTEERREAATEADALSAADKLAKRVSALEPRAADGDAYRNDLVAEALAEGVRALGQDFDSETYEEQLRGAPLKVVKRMRDDWKAAGDARFAGGRQTNDGDEPAQVEAAPLVADAAYRS